MITLSGDGVKSAIPKIIRETQAKDEHLVVKNVRYPQECRALAESFTEASNVKSNV